MDERLFAPPGEIASSPEERADALTSALEDPDTRLVLDVTGGDATSSLLRTLPDQIAVGGFTSYFGISDNSTVHCWLERAAPEVERVYWYPTNLVLDAADSARISFERILAGESVDLPVRWVHGEEIDAPLAGGNVRCLLKLAGTGHMPDLSDSALVLESASGGLGRIRAHFDQLADMAVLASLRGLILGEFGSLRSDEVEQVAHYAAEIGPRGLPICVTDKVGHGSDTVPLRLGQSPPLRAL